MPKIEFPKQLKDLLEDSDLQAPIRAFADRVGEILADNKLTFFPDYTDHGEAHVNRVLKSEVELVPKEVWKSSKKDSDPRLLCDADAAVLIGATLLHDIAMHLHPDGFLELVGKDSRFQPLPWFFESHEGQVADVAWHELWEEYVREARRFSDRDLTNIIGAKAARDWKFNKLPEYSQWEKEEYLNHRLIVGEFIRRHHARLAHEIAIYGFPGLEAGSGAEQFPAMGAKGYPLNPLADLIGLTARSHGLNLRVCKAYLDASPSYSGTPRPMGTAVLYPMALLRVADYLQIDRQRAPAVLLQLRNPQSPISVQEWQKHLAVQHIGPANDPRGKMVTVSSDLSLPLYLQLRELLSGLQAEMDHSTAVLDEAYGAQSTLGLDRLNLAIRRVDSNLQSPAFRDALPYVPNKTGFAADPNLLTLLVEPLYGKEPGVGVRELMQNAVDAVCELDAWCKVHDVPIDSLDLPEQEGDVMIDFIKRDDGSWFLRVQDRGIGMTSDTIQNYFLRAGASFRRSSEWSKEFLDDNGKPRLARAGRFGIGVFAVFLLGPSFKMWTRHAGTDKSMGYMVEATENSQLIEIQRVDDCCVGTKIEVEISSESAEILELEKEKYSDYTRPSKQIDWFCWDWPNVIKRVTREKKHEMLAQKYVYPIRSQTISQGWFVIYPKDFDAVYWTFLDVPRIVCNGIKIEDIREDSIYGEGRFFWPSQMKFRINEPNIWVLDSDANLPLTIQRYSLSHKEVPFVNELARDVVLSFIAYALVCGATSQHQTFSKTHNYPLQDNKLPRYDHFNHKDIDHIYSDRHFRWCATSQGMIPADKYLCTLHNTESYLLYGKLFFPEQYYTVKDTLQLDDWFLGIASSAEYVTLPWLGIISWGGINEYDERIKNVADVMEEILDEMNIINVIDGETAFRIVYSDCNGIRHYSDTEASSLVYNNEKQLKFGIWKETQRYSSQRRWFEAQSGVDCENFNIESFIETLETNLGDDDGVLFVAEIRKNNTEYPESMIAKIWNECLGTKPIPFDPVAREALIADGCKHPDLKRHIEAWQEMKRTGSKWATGEWMNEE